MASQSSHARPASTWTASPDSFLVRVHGDSMKAPSGRSYIDGDTLLIDPDKSPKDGDRVVAKLSGSTGLTFRVFKQSEGRTWLEPLNFAAHGPIVEPFELMGTVVAKWQEE